jgi:carbamoyltransferase
MNILGINASGENPSACLLENGILKAFCHEERLTRLKGSHNLFPTNSISWCLKSQDKILDNIDKIAVSWDCNKYPVKMLYHLTRLKINLFFNRKYLYPSTININGNLMDGISHLLQFEPNLIKKKIRDNLRYSGHKGKIPEIVFVPHHLSHAFQAYYHSPFTNAIILVADGHGEENCISGFSMKDDKLEKILEYNIPYSLGWFYSAFTAYLGFNPSRDEGKLMGLAAYGERRKSENPWLERLDKIIRITSDGFELDPLYFKFSGNEYNARYSDKLVKFLTDYNPQLSPISLNEKINLGIKSKNRYLLDDYIDLAFAVQDKLEKILVTLVNRMVKETGIRNLCFAGGVALNCKANGMILDKTKIENIFVHPASSDDGSCIGSAFYVSKELGEKIRQPLRHVQYGPSFTNDEIEKSIKKAKITYKKTNNISKEVSELLVDGKIIGWFQGGSEMGPRALGGRSIIAFPNNQHLKEKINNEIKYRENWRPYCPSILLEEQCRYISNPVETPFMVLARYATQEAITNVPAIIHTDNTVRPQTVRKEILPLWYNLINEIKNLSGEGIILNTSFNVRGEPIVNSPFDALRTFYSTGLDALAIGDFLITK